MLEWALTEVVTLLESEMDAARDSQPIVDAIEARLGARQAGCHAVSCYVKVYEGPEFEARASGDGWSKIGGECR